MAGPLTPSPWFFTCCQANKGFGWPANHLDFCGYRKLLNLPKVTETFHTHSLMLHTWSHRVERVLSFLSSRPNWDSTAPLTYKRVCSPLLWFGGRGGTQLACGRGSGGVPIPTRGQILWTVVHWYSTVCTCTGICVLCAWSSLPFIVSLLHFLSFRKIFETLLLTFGKHGSSACPWDTLLNSLPN